MNFHSPYSRDVNQISTHTSARRGRTFRLPVALFMLALFLGACGTTGSPVKSFTKGDELAYYDFSSPGTFEEGAYSDGNARLEIRDGAYHVDLLVGDSVLWYGQWGDSFRDAIIDVDATQTTEDQNTIYGVMCRARGAVGQVPSKDDPELAALAGESNTDLIASAAQVLEGTPEVKTEATLEPLAESTREATSEATSEPTAKPTVEATSEATPEVPADSLNVNNGDGYLFLIEATGRYAIMISRGRQTNPLVDWTASSVIKTGAAQNHIRAVCLGDYLALYINGEFVADATNDIYTKGQVGLVAASANRLGEQVAFDNLTISDAKAGE